MKLNLDKPFLDMTGNAIPGDTQAKYLASVLAGAFQGFPPVKALDFAMALFSKGETEIDATDLEIMRKGVGVLIANGVSNLVVAQLEKSLTAAAVETISGV